uniref:Yippee domain-containing protein n=1 Tax=Sciurus vulgaris TaxID=55149 RepID=A0A8D2CN37_SCIVU
KRAGERRAGEVQRGNGREKDFGCGPAEKQVSQTGLHAVADIYCENCKIILGWKNGHTFKNSQKYKGDKYIIQLAHMIEDNS